MTVKEHRSTIKKIWENDRDPLEALWDWAKEPEQEERRHERWKALEEWAGSHKRQQDHDTDEWRAWRKRQRVYRKKAAGTKPDESNVPGIEDGGWHPDAQRVQVNGGAGAFGRSVPPRLVWHTTEGFGLPTYSGSHPHFTIDPKTGRLYQHISIKNAAMALKNPAGGVETNHARAIQVEIIGFAGQSSGWSEQVYDHLADLARWIEQHAGVKRVCRVKFDNSVNHMSAAQWNGYDGHCGHQHVPENDHWDPGSLRIDKII